MFTNIAVDSLELLRFIGDRINAQMQLPDYVDLAVYGLWKSLRLFGCGKLSLTGEMNAVSRYDLPNQNADVSQYMITNTIGCIPIRTPLHISQSLPIDSELQFATLQA